MQSRLAITTAPDTVPPFALAAPLAAAATAATSGTTRQPRSRKPPAPIANPFRILIDDREIISGGTWTFQGLIGDSKENYRPLVIETVSKRMETGDYSIVGLERFCCVERKSLSDVYNTLGQGRKNFEAEHVRMAAIRQRCLVETGGAIQCSVHVVIEAEWSQILRKREYDGREIRSKISPMSIIGTASHWSQRYGVCWWVMAGRRAAEIWCFRLLRDFWRQRVHYLESLAEQL
jgi:hypothetical protein